MKYIILLMTLALLSSCHQREQGRRPMTKAKMDSLRNDLLNTDIDFSAMSEEKGRNTAFIAYAADNATLLRPNSMPVTGKDSIRLLLSAHPDSSRKLTWIPISADVARSGEIGYTYGTYALQTIGRNREEGTYCTIWHKDSTRKWKFVLDTGNEGLSKLSD